MRRKKPGQSPDAAVAELMAEGVTANGATAVGYSQMFGELDLTECAQALDEQTRKVRKGDLTSLEAILAAQALTLNAMFTQLARQASTMTVVDQIDRFTRLALKAQSQCRTTVETLASIRNPPSAVFARQANIAHGPQQVNNAGMGSEAPARGPRSSAENRRSGRDELLESHHERLDSGTTATTGKGNPTVAALGTFNRPQDR